LLREIPDAIHNFGVYRTPFQIAALKNGRDECMASVNVDKMALKELLDLETRVKKAILNAKERERADLKNKIASLAENAGFSVSELFGGGRGKGGKVAVKYRNKDNPAETWTGRGRQPKWLAAKLAKGSKLADFSI
jgi:DNA-binding protein H-NS